MSVLAAPALPLHKAGPYVAAAYIVFAALILIYVAIMARRLSRAERDLDRLRHEVEAATTAPSASGENEVAEMERAQ